MYYRGIRYLCAASLAAALTPGVALADSNNSQDLLKSLFKKYKGQQVESIADAARRSKRLAGTAVSVGALMSDDAGYSAVLNAEYDYMTAENSGKWGSLQSAPGVWDFAPHDVLVQYSQDNAKAFKGHTLVWHSQSPDFINDDLTATELATLLETHVATTVNRYAGQFYSWDVVNEAIDEDGSFRNSVYYSKLGEEYIANAFHQVRNLDRKAKLFYNDYNIAGFNAKSDGVYEMLKGLKAAGVPVDGIGFQMHITAGTAPSFEEIVANFERFAELGLEITVSELDVRVADLPWDQPTKLAIQQQVYQRVISACMKVKKCDAVTTWGFTDTYSWVDATYGEDDPLPFNERYERKPAYFGLIDGFMGLPADALGVTPNLVANGNVEAGLDGWSSLGGSLERAHKKAYNGESFVNVTERTDTWNGPAYDILGSVRGGQSFDAEVWASIANANRDTVTLSAHYRCAGEEDVYTQLATDTVKKNKWSQLSGELTLPECALDVAELYLEGPAAGVDLQADAMALRPHTLVPDDTGLGANIVENSDFEADAFGWFGFGDAMVDASDLFASTGSQSGLVTNRLASWQGPATSLFLDAQPGVDYQVLAWVRMQEGNAQVNATIKTSCAGADDQYLYIGSAQASTNSWEVISGTVTMPDCDLSDVTLYFEGPAADANFFIDDVYVRPVLATTDPSVIVNTGFEDGVTGWSAWGGSIISASSTQAYTGQSSALLSNRSGSWQGPVLSLTGSLVAGETYEISAWGRLAGVSSDNLFITVKTACADGSELYSQVDAITATDTQWQQLAGSITLPSCDLTEVTVYFDGPAEAADIYLDDVLIQGQENAGPVNLITNSGFETGVAGWTTWGGMLSTSSDAYSGSQSVLHSQRTGNWQGPVYNLLPAVVAGKTYDITGFSKIGGGDAANVSITVKTTCEDGTSAYNWGGASAVNDATWTEVSGSVTLPDCALTEVSLYFDGPAQELGIYLDEVSVFEAE